MRLPSSPGISPRQSMLRESSSQMAPAQAVELARAAEELATQLTDTVAELRMRKEEADVCKQESVTSQLLTVLFPAHP